MTLAAWLIVYRLVRVEYVIARTGYFAVEWFGARAAGRAG